MDNRIVLDNTYYELEQREIYKAIWIGIPIDFVRMNPIAQMIKYPNISESALVLTNADTTCNFIFNKLNVTMELNERMEFVQQNIKIVTFQLSTAQIVDEPKLMKNDRFEIYFFSYKIPCMDFDGFNAVYYIWFRNSLLITNFNCLDSKRDDMIQLFDMIVTTLENKEGL